MTNLCERACKTILWPGPDLIWFGHLSIEGNGKEGW